MATTFTAFRPTPIRASSSRKPEPIRPKTVSTNWWTPLLGWSSEQDYFEPTSTDAQRDPTEKPARQKSRFAPGCFTEEKAKQLRRKTLESSTFHDIMYHSAIASRLASDLSGRYEK